MNLIKKNYHWIIAAVLLLELGIYLGIHNNVTSLYIIPVTTELGITRGSASLAYSAPNLFSFFPHCSPVSSLQNSAIGSLLLWLC